MRTILCLRFNLIQPMSINGVHHGWLISTPLSTCTKVPPLRTRDTYPIHGRTERLPTATMCLQYSVQSIRFHLRTTRERPRPILPISPWEYPYNQAHCACALQDVWEGDQADARQACVSGLRQVNSSSALTKFLERKNSALSGGGKHVFQGMSFLIRQSEESIHIRTVTGELNWIEAG